MDIPENSPEQFESGTPGDLPGEPANLANPTRSRSRRANSSVRVAPGRKACEPTESASKDSGSTENPPLTAALRDEPESEGRENGKSEPEEQRLIAFAKDSLAYNQDRGDYWRKTASGIFVKASDTQLKRHIRRAGYQLPPGSAWENSRFDNLLCHVEEHLSVACAFDLAGHRAGIFLADGGRRVLVPSGTQLIEPKAGDFPNIRRLHEQLFVEDEQIDRVLAWQKIALQDYYSGRPDCWRQSQLLCLVGPANCGKSFWQILFGKMLNAGSADPWPLLTGGDAGKFTKDVAESPHWLMQDKPPFRKLADRANFTGHVKTNLTTSILDVHAKGRDKVSLPTFRRLTLSTNDDSDNLGVLPNLDDSMRDKLIIVRCGVAEMSLDYQENLARFVGELPAWVHFLLNDFRIPEEIQDRRFGVTAWCHPEIEKELADFDPLERFQEILEKVLFGDGDSSPQRLSAAEIHAQMVNHSIYGHLARQILPASSISGRFLSSLVKKKPDRYEKRESKGRVTYLICAP